MTWIAIIAACLVLLVAGWVAYVPGRYPLRGTRARPSSITTTDGWQLSIYHRAARSRAFREPVILCHGLGNNHTFFEFDEPWNFARFLSDRGFDCYSVDLRGAGPHERPTGSPYEVSFDDYARTDAPALIAEVCRRAGTSQVLWIGHSMGGLVGLAAAAGRSGHAIKALCTIGSPAFFQKAPMPLALIRASSWLAPWGAFDAGLIRYVAPLAGRVGLPDTIHTANLRNITVEAQRQLLANTFCPMYRGVLEQLDDWVTNDVFRSVDRTVDYRARLRELACPVLVVGGSIDFLCPERATRSLFEALPRERRELALFGKEHGQADDYGHGDLVVGWRAPDEVYPTLVQFLSRQATTMPVEAEVRTAEPLLTSAVHA